LSIFWSLLLVHVTGPVQLQRYYDWDYSTASELAPDTVYWSIIWG